MVVLDVLGGFAFVVDDGDRFLFAVAHTGTAAGKWLSPQPQPMFLRNGQLLLCPC